MTFNYYEKISTINEILKKTHVLSDNLGDLSKEIKPRHNYSNFRIISQNVQILEHSKEYPTQPLDIMFGRNIAILNGIDSKEQTPCCMFLGKLN